MARYEVFIPAALAGEFNVTLKVDADNWMAALKTGLKRIGEHGTQVVNIMVDIMEDNSIHVTDSTSGRVFRIKELDEAAQPAPVAAAPAPAPVAPAPAPRAAAPAPVAHAPVVAPPAPVQPAAVRPPEPAPRPPAPKAPPPAARPPVGAQTLPGSEAPTPKEMPAVQMPEPVEPKPVKHVAPPAKQPEPVAAKKPEPVAAKKPEPAPAKKLEPAPAKKPEPMAEVRRSPTTEPRRVEQVERPSQPITGPIGRTKTNVALEDVLSDLFERTQDVYGLEREKGMYFLLDLALEKIPADAGSVFVSDLAAADLELLSVRGPKAADLKKLNLRMPMGVGVVGFCAQEAVSLAISDTQKDPRFYREVSEKIGYEAKSILCAPMVSGGRSFGCIEIINKKGTSHFTDSELAILAYVAHQGAKYLESL